jgi:hypothetical protein
VSQIDERFAGDDAIGAGEIALGGRRRDDKARERGD